MVYHGLSINSMVIFHGKRLNNQMVCTVYISAYIYILAWTSKNCMFCGSGLKSSERPKIEQLLLLPFVSHIEIEIWYISYNTDITYIHTYIHACMHACMHAYIHTYIYIYIRIYIYRVDSAWNYKMHVLWMPYTYTFLFGKFLTGNSAREMVGHGDISEPVAQLLPYFVCVWYTIPWAANHATIFVSCRSVNSLQYKPSITSTSSPFPCGCGRNSYWIPCLFAYFFLADYIVIQDSASSMFVGYMMWVDYDNEYQIIAIMWLSKAVCLRLPIETLAHNFDSDVFQVSIFLWVALHSLFWWCPRDSPE